MRKRLRQSKCKGKKFSSICRSIGFADQGVWLSKFDSDYAYVLGQLCYFVLASGLNGYIPTVTGLKNPVYKWRCGAVPISAMMVTKRFKSSAVMRAAIYPAKVDLNGTAYRFFRRNETVLLKDDVYRIVDGLAADHRTTTLCVEDQDYWAMLQHNLENMVPYSKQKHVEEIPEAKEVRVSPRKINKFRWQNPQVPVAVQVEAAVEDDRQRLKLDLEREIRKLEATAADCAVALKDAKDAEEAARQALDLKNSKIKVEADELVLLQTRRSDVRAIRSLSNKIDDMKRHNDGFCRKMLRHPAVKLEEISQDKLNEFTKARIKAQNAYNAARLKLLKARQQAMQRS